MPVDPTAAKAIFLAAAERPAAERSAYLDEACAGDAALRARVEILLSALAEGSFPDFVAGRNPGDETQSTAAAATSGPDPDLPGLLPSREPGHLGRLDRFEIHSIVGRGGMGIVVKALDESLDRIVAIKFLGSRYASNGTARQRFIREAKAVAAIAHEHVVTIHAVDDERPYLVMQYVSGVSLQERIDRQGPMELKEILRIGRQIASGLAAAHKEGLVHRDIKPSNVLLENGVERVKITDFGLARAVDDVSVTASGVIAGTPMYMSPEQARGELVDARSDLFSLGSVLYAMCTGHPPFRASGTMAVMKRVIEDVPRPIRELNPAIPDWLEAIVARLHEKSPDDRFQKATEVAEILGQRLAHLQKPTTVPRPATLPKPVVEPTPKKLPAATVAPAPGLGLSNHIWTLLMLLLILPMVARGWFGSSAIGDAWPIWVGLFGGLGLALLAAVRAARHAWRKQRTAAILTAIGVIALLAIVGSAVHALYSSSGVGDLGSIWLIGSVVALCLAGLFIGLAEWRAASYRASPEAPRGPHVTGTGIYWIIVAASLLPVAIVGGRMAWLGMFPSHTSGITSLHITWYNPDGDVFVELDGNGQVIAMNADSPRPINGPMGTTRNVAPGNYVIRINRGGLRVAERRVYVDPGQGVEIAFPNLPPGDPATWTALFNGQDLSGWKPADDNFSPWKVEDGVMVGRAGMLVGDRADWANFHLFAEVQVKSGGIGGLLVRNSNGPIAFFEVKVVGGPVGTGTLIRHDGESKSTTPADPVGRPGDWLAIEVIARGSLVVTRVNGRVAAQAIGGDGPLARGRFAIVAEANTELRVRQLLVKTLPVGAAPLPAAAPFPATVAPWYQEEWATHLKKKVIETDGAGVQLVLIPPGEADLGTSSEDLPRLNTEWQAALKQAPNPNPWRTWELAPPSSEGPRRHVRVTRPFYLGAQEVTVAQYRAFVTATNYQTEAEATGHGGYAFNGSGWLRLANVTWKNPGRDWKPTDKHPVVQVTHADAEKFCAWLSQKEGCVYRLPTEAEWEYACRAGTIGRYSFGNDAADLSQFGWAAGSDLAHPVPVGGKKPNPWGLYDMYGNVQEWCAKGFQGAHYSVSPTTDPPDFGRSEPGVMRGGGWANHPFMCRTTCRLIARPDKADDHTGFRVLREIPAPGSSPKLVHLRSFTPGKDPLPVVVAGTDKAVAIDGDAWRIENAINAGNFNARIGELLENVPKDGVLVLRAKVKVKASDKLSWGSLDFGAANHLFPSWDQWPADKARYDRNTSEWTEREVRHPAAEFQKLNPPAVYLYAGLHANGVLWLKDAELLHEPQRKP